MRSKTFGLPVLLFLLLASFLEASEESSALNYLNSLRKQSGLIPLHSNKQLDKAAFSHAKYLLRQQKIGHFERSGYKGYTGRTPSDRVIYHGYPSKDVMENVTVNVKDYKESVDKLFSAIYHRFVFLNLEKDQIGIGKALTKKKRRITNAYVYNLGSSKQSKLCRGEFLPVGGVEYMKSVCKERKKLVPRHLYEQQKEEIKTTNPKVVLFPYAGQKRVPPVFYEEYPDPLPDYKVSGYPISVQFNTAYYKSVKLLSFKLYDETGKELKKSRFLTHKSDPNDLLKKGQYALMPLKRLNYSATYTAKVEANLDGKRYQKTWSFTTVHPKKKLYHITKKRSEIKIKGDSSILLYFVPNGPNDVLRRYTYRGGKIKVSFYDQNTLMVKFPKRLRSTISIQAGGRTVTFK